MNRDECLGKILRGGLVPIVIDDNLPEEACLEEVLAAGIEAVEVSCRHPRAVELIVRLKARFGDRLAVGGASLIEDGPYRDGLRAAGKAVPHIAEAAQDADFLVSLLPFREITYQRYARSHVLIPGVATPGEAHQALDWGANLVKFVAPQLAGGPAYLRGMDAATHRGFPFFVTGGMRPEVLDSYVQAQTLVFGAGFDLILSGDYARMHEQFDPATLRRALTAYAAALGEARRKHQPSVPFASGDAAAISAASGRFMNVTLP